MNKRLVLIGGGIVAQRAVAPRQKKAVALVLLENTAQAKHATVSKKMVQRPAGGAAQRVVIRRRRDRARQRHNLRRTLKMRKRLMLLLLVGRSLGALLSALVGMVLGK